MGEKTRETIRRSALGCSIAPPIALPLPKLKNINIDFDLNSIHNFEKFSFSKKTSISLTTFMIRNEINKNFHRLQERNLESGNLISLSILKSLFEEIISAEAEEILRQVLEFEINLFWNEKLLKCENNRDLHYTILDLVSEQDFQEYIVSKYPLLRERCLMRVELCTAAMEKFLIRFSQDFCELKSLGFLTSEEVEVRSINNTGSDSHLLAQRVLIIGFSNEDKIVYKPRPVDGEAALYELISWINDVFPRRSLLGARTLAKQEYGWLEYIGQRNVSSHHQIADYYYRYGKLTALIRFLSGNDIHFENLVAFGEMPIIIDAETILPTSSFTRDTLPHGGHDVTNREDDTVLYTGMVDQADFFTDFTGSPLSVPPDRKGNWSDIQISSKGNLTFICDVEIRKHNHLPSINGVPENCVHFTYNIISGYEEVFGFLMTNRISSVHKIRETISLYSNIRAIFRYTNVYEKFRQGLYTPFALASIENSDSVLSDLPMICDDRPGHEGLIALEWEALWYGDIPHFQCHAFSRSLEGGGVGSITNYLQESAYDIFKRKIARRSSIDIKDDIDYLKYILISKEKHFSCGAKSSVKPSEDYEPVDYFRDVLDALIIDKGRILFSDSRINNYIECDTGIINHNIYSGVGGITFSLLYGLEAPQEKEKIARLGEICLLHATQDSSRLIGACEGLGGFIWLSSHLGYKTREKLFFDIGIELAKQASRVIFKDRYYDVFSGSAGLIHSLYSLNAVSNNEILTNYIDCAGQFLLEKSVKYDGMMAWDAPLVQSKPGSGFAHGAAGIGSALIKAYLSTRDTKYLEAVASISRFLEKCFIEKSLKWVDYIGDNGLYYSNFWCHGSPGVFQFYLEAQRHDIDVRMSSDLFSRIGSVICHDFRCDNESLCHGTFGNLDPIMELGTHDTNVNNVIIESFRKYKNREHVCGTINNLHSHGLFTGQSGITYEFLRARDPMVFPSVLRFDSPISK
ncbi:type 2 lanthipeptide synthetase LanM family protein [Asaia sp. HN010]|uniref:type 2 lanthipeptide synthetase LanM family protein n=1 Tax=Asaia sp. HN010 TaxID=3081233 RepID=UPI003015B0F4